MQPGRLGPNCIDCSTSHAGSRVALVATLPLSANYAGSRFARGSREAFGSAFALPRFARHACWHTAGLLQYGGGHMVIPWTVACQK